MEKVPIRSRNNSYCHANPILLYPPHPCLACIGICCDGGVCKRNIVDVNANRASFLQCFYPQVDVISCRVVEWLGPYFFAAREEILEKNEEISALGDYTSRMVQASNSGLQYFMTGIFLQEEASEISDPLFYFVDWKKDAKCLCAYLPPEHSFQFIWRTLPVKFWFACGVCTREGRCLVYWSKHCMERQWGFILAS